MGRVRDILKDNVLELTAPEGRFPQLGTIKALSAASGVSTGTIDRLRKAQSDLGIDHLAGLAGAFGMEPYELLVPDIAALRSQADFSDDHQDELHLLSCLREIRRLRPRDYQRIESTIRKLADALQAADMLLAEQADDDPNDPHVK